MTYNSFLLIASSDTIHYEQYNNLPLDRIELYKNLTAFRMIYFEDGFKFPLDIINKCVFDKYYFQASESEKKEMLNIWNLSTANGALAINCLVNEGVNCHIVTNFDNSINQIERYINENDNAIIGISTTFILNWSEIGRICKKIKSISQNTKIVLGGSFVSSSFLLYNDSFFYKPMKKYKIDYVLTSPNSEVDLATLYSVLNKLEPFETVKNLIYLDERGEAMFTCKELRKPIISFCDNALTAALQNAYKNTIQLRTGVGCPFSCKFCSYPSMTKYLLEDLDKLENIIKKIHESGIIKNIIFIDDNVNVPLSRFDSLLDILLKYQFNWYGFLRVQFIDEHLARKMKKSGCDGVYLGLESGSNDILKLMNKKTNVQKYENGIRALKEANITTFASFIVGFPGESESTINETIDFVNHEVLLDYYSLKEFYYDPNSPIFKEAERFDLTGSGNKWSHYTMESGDANTYKELMYKKIVNCCHVDPDLGMWYLIYLRINGFSWESISTLQRYLNKLIDYDLNEDFKSRDKIQLISELKSYLRDYVTN